MATIYDHLFERGDIIEVGCWSHCRRDFLEALASEPKPVNEALTLIAELFMIERKLANAPPKASRAVTTRLFHRMRS